MPDPRLQQSPNCVHIARFSWAGEIRFGPAYFHLDIDGRAIAGTVFGECAVWSGDDRYLAVQEWLHTEEALGPKTMLAVIDTEHWVKCAVPPFDGFCEPQSWNGLAIDYAEETYDRQGKHSNGKRLDLNCVVDWQPLTLSAS